VLVKYNRIGALGNNASADSVHLPTRQQGGGYTVGAGKNTGQAQETTGEAEKATEEAAKTTGEAERTTEEAEKTSEQAHGSTDQGFADPNANGGILQNIKQKRDIRKGIEKSKEVVFELGFASSLKFSPADIAEQEKALAVYSKQLATRNKAIKHQTQQMRTQLAGSANFKASSQLVDQLFEATQQQLKTAGEQKDEEIKESDYEPVCNVPSRVLSARADIDKAANAAFELENADASIVRQNHASMRKSIVRINELWALMSRAKDDSSPGKLASEQNSLQCQYPLGSVVCFVDFDRSSIDNDPDQVFPLLPMRVIPSWGDGNCCARAIYGVVKPEEMLGCAREHEGGQAVDSAVKERENRRVVEMRSK